MSKIQDAIQVAATHFASEVVNALRTATLSDILALTGGSAAAAPVARRGRPPKAAVAAAAPANHVPAAAPAAKKAPKVIGKKRTRGKGPDAASLDRILKAIESNPGLRSEELRKKVDLDAAAVKAGLAKLRETKRVKTKGERRATTYSV